MTRTSVTAARVAMSFASAALLALASLHVLSPEFDPSWRMVSEYANGHYGWLLSLMFVAWGLSAWALAVAISPGARTMPVKIGLVCLTLAGLGQAMAAVFDINHDALHSLAGALGILGLPIAAMSISVKLARTAPWSAARRSLLWTANLTWVSMESDDTLILLFMCCHPSLSPASQIALTLRAVGGLSTAEVARAFLVPEETMTRRISRAKQSIKDSGIPFRMPPISERAERLGAVLHVLYLIFTEGYASTSGPSLHRAEMAAEAIRLTRLIHRLLPADSELTGLLALMLLTDARRPARTGPDGELVPMAEQDRSLWNAGQIAEGVALVSEALPKGAVGAYQLQAAIAALHDEAPNADATDWAQIVALYELLRRISDNPVVALNHAVAVAMAQGARSGLDLLDSLEGDERLNQDHRLYAVRAHLLEMSGDRVAAQAAYLAAAGRTSNLPQQRYLNSRAARLTS